MRHPVQILMISILLGNSLAFAEDREVEFGPWENLFVASRKVRSANELPASARVEPVDELELKGAEPLHPFKFNELFVDGQWGIQESALTQKNGRSAAIRLGAAEDFELEMGVNAEGDGGWFLLMGFNDEWGHCLYNMTMRTSGSPWYICQFQRGQSSPELEQEVARYENRGNESMTVRVVDGELSVTIGRRKLIENETLADYKAGEIILGTYDTKYGPKPLKIYGIRMRKSKSE